MPPDRERDLDRELADLGSHIEYPPTPDLARSARRRIDEEATRPARRGWFGPLLSRPGWAAAAALVLVVAVPVFSPAARESITGWFGGGQAAQSGAGGASSGQESGVSGAGSAEDLPSSSSGGDLPTSSGGPARSLGKKLGLGERITLREARARTDAPILLSRTPGLGNPDEVYANGPPGEGRIVLVYHARRGLPAMAESGIGLLLTEAPGSVESAYLAKGAPNEPRPEKVSVGDEQAYWFPDGRQVHSQAGKAENLSGGALLWEREDRALLMRTDLSKEEAVRIAEAAR